jgi:hypothetical protein
MVSSIYHFYADILESKQNFAYEAKLVDFPYKRMLFDYFSKDGFPNIILKHSPSNRFFQGGEVLSIIERKKYKPLQLDPPIPTTFANLGILRLKSSSLKSLRKFKRPLYYLLRVRNGIRGKSKVCLTSGAFFETVPAQEVLVRTLFPDRFKQVTQSDADLLQKLFTKPISFCSDLGLKINVEMSVDILPEGNILNPAKYPEIADNTLNFVVPSHEQKEDDLHIQRMETAFGERKASSLFKQLRIFTIKHHFNGPFLVFQTNLS